MAQVAQRDGKHDEDDDDTMNMDQNMESDDGDDGDDMKESPDAQPKRRPNLLVTGTPGVGKTSLIDTLCEETGLTKIDVNDLVKTHKFHEGKDEERDCLIVDEDKLMDYIEESIIKTTNGGNVFDTHLCGGFDPNWFDLVIVLRCNNTQLYDRLEERGYAQKKIQENVEAEIMRVIYDEALEAFDKKIVIQLQNDDIDQQEDNIIKIKQWMVQFAKDNNDNLVLID